MQAPCANLLQAAVTAQTQFMSTVESQPTPKSGSLRWSLPDASLHFAGLEWPIYRENKGGDDHEEGFRRWVEAIWSLRTRPEDTFNDCPAEQTKSWYDIRGMANDDVRAHMEFVTKLFDESIKVKTAFIDYRRVLPGDRVSFQQFMKADIKEHILRNERRMELEATEEEEEEEEGHRTTRLTSVLWEEE